MPLSAGTRLGPYEVRSPIGKGGMGEVYQATDTRLDRTVAVKVLPEHFAESPTSKARFEREAKAISQLNHPNICTLYDVHLRQGYGGQVGDAGDIDYMVMEYIEGDTLAERLKKGPLKLDQALEYGIQIADGLDKAHRAGIVHRDLKPGNIMLTKPGVKILDFGLARQVDDAGGLESSDAPTEQRDLTEAHAIVGTPQYMAPEQLEGKTVDGRADIHALGAVLYEMLTGRKAFEGESHARLSSAILTSTPRPPSELVPAAPPALDFAIAKCFEKDPDERWRAAHDIAIALRGVSAGEQARGQVRLEREKNTSIRGIVSAAILGALVAAIALWAWGPVSDESATTVVRTTLKVPEGLFLDDPTAIAISPDDRRVAFAAVPTFGTETSLYIRELSGYEAVVVPSSRGSRLPVFSPDGQTLGFRSGSRVWSTRSIDGGEIQEPGGGPDDLRDVSWSDDGTVWFGSDSGIWRLSPGEREPERVSTRQPVEGAHKTPVSLPDGGGVVFTMTRGTQSPSIAYLSLETGEHQVLFEGVAKAYLESGHLVFARESEIFAAPFDLQSLSLTGALTLLAENVRTRINGAPFFAVGNNTLMYAVQQDQDRKLVWVERDGTETVALDSDEDFHNLSISPDGTRFVGDFGPIWVYDFARGTQTLIADISGGTVNRWTPDGSEIVYSIDTNVYAKASDGTGEARLLLEHEARQFPLSFSPDGRFLALTHFTETGNRDIWLSESGGDAAPFIATEANENAAAISPNGRWIAYQSDESGRFEIYVQPFPEPGRRTLISARGGRAPVWARSGDELFYRQDTALMSVAIERGPELDIGIPAVLFDGPYQADTNGHPNYDVSPDGERFLMIREGDAGVSELKLILNLEAELRSR